MEMEIQHTKYIECRKAFPRGNFMIINAYLKKQKINKQPNFIHQRLEKEQMRPEVKKTIEM